MKTFCVSASRAVSLLVLLVVGFVISSHVAHAAVLNSYDFNTLGDLTSNFNNDANEAYTEIPDGGISDSRAVNVDGFEGLYAAKTGYAALTTGQTLTLSAYFYNDGGNGYGSLGFVDASPSSQSEGIPSTAHGMTFRFHGGGGSYYRNTTDAADTTWPGLADATWYRVIFSLTKEATADSYAADVQVWKSDTSGNLIEQVIDAPVIGYVNADLAGQTLYPFFGTGLTDRIVKVDNVEVTDSLFVGTPYAPTFSGAGSGTSIDPYQITTCGQIAEVNSHLNDAFILKNNLDCTLANNDIIIGSGDHPFTGVFDGDNHTITVNINSTADDRTGLFRYVNEGTLKNLTVGGSVSSVSQNTGMIAGQVMNSLLLDNLHSSGTVESEGDSTGGLFGSTFCVTSISNSTSSATVNGTTATGGLIGIAGCMGPGPNITNSSATGNVTGTDNVGGLIGSSYASNLDHVFATGNIIGQDYLGGLIGYNASFDPYKIFHAYATGSVSGRNYLGGFIGYMDSGIISQSFSTGNVTSAAGDNIGGFLGHVGTPVTIRNSYSRGNATIDGGEGSIGGLIGEMSDASIINTYSTGIPTSTTDLAKGGFGGDASINGTIFTSFWDKDSSGSIVGCWQNTDCGVTGKTTAQMKQRSTFTNAGWNFNSIWGQDNSTNDGYPYILPSGADIVPDPIPTPADTPAVHHTSVGGYASAAALAKAGVTLAPVATNKLGGDKTQTCPTDQILTQNLHAPSQNGKYNAYTKAIVTDAKILQAHLNRLGFNSGSVDGFLGPISDGAIKRMQTFLKTTPDGFVGPITRNLINNSCTK